MSNYNSITYTDLTTLKKAIISEFSSNRRGNDKSNYGEKEKPEIINDLPIQYQAITSDFFNQITIPLETVNKDAVNYDDEQNKIIYDISDLEIQTANLQSITNFQNSNHGCDGACAGLCYNACYNTCKGCSGDCTGTCQGCGGDCTGTCQGCGGSCGDCTGGCKGTCSSACTLDGCTLQCIGGCEGSCWSHCSIDGCTSNCGGNCTGICKSDCTKSCTGSCSGGVANYAQ